MEDIIDLNGEIYVTLAFLEKYGVNRQTVVNGMRRYRKGSSQYFAHIPHPRDRRVKWIRYAGLSPQLFQNHRLPDEQDLAISLMNKKTDDTTLAIRMKLDFAYSEGYRAFQKHFLGAFTELDIIISHARSMAMFTAIKRLKQFDIPIHRSFACYCQYDDVSFVTTKIRVFYAKFRSFLEKGHQAFIHGAMGKSKIRKLTQAHVDQIISLFKSPKQLSGRDIHLKLNEWALLKGFSQLSLTSIKTVLADPYIQNQCRPVRNGKSWEQLYFDPWRLREHPAENGELWELDGSKFQFPYNDGRKPKFMNLIVVVDVHSRKVIGHSMASVEDHEAILTALRNAIENVRYIPSQLLIDNASAFKHKRFLQVEEQFNLYGSIIRRHKPRNSRDKGHVERFFRTFQTCVCRGKDGYIGEGIKSKDVDSHPREDILAQAFDRKGMRNQMELQVFCEELLVKYNDLKLGGRHSPDVCFKIGKLAKGAIQVNENDIALMFWSRITDYHLRNSMVLLSEGSFRNQQFQYIIEDQELRLRLNGTNVIVCYLRNERSKIKIFTIGEKYICDLFISERFVTVKPNQGFDDLAKVKSSSTSKFVYPSENVRQEVLEQSKLNRFPIPEQHQLYKEETSFDRLIIKTKDNE